MSSLPDASRFSAAELLTALRALPYREAAFLLTRLTRGHSLAESAAFYGIAPDAFSVHLLRAALDWSRAAALPCRLPENEGEEDVWARALAAALERDTAVPPSLEVPVAMCRRMRALAPEVVETLQVLEREEEDSPRRRREDALRRLAVIALVALTAYLYFSRPPDPSPARRATPPGMRR